MRYEPVHRGILAVDIEGFGRRDRTDTDRIRMREAMKEMVVEGLRRSGIATSKRTLKDQGDGILALVDPRVSKCRLIHPLIPWLALALDAYNRNVDDEARMRLRVCVHAGEVVPHETDHTGEDLIHAYRLLDSKLLRQRLAAADAPLILIVSQRIYHGVVRHRYARIDPSTYEAARITTKETKRAMAWIWKPTSAGSP
jgi:class 3 adenylate cyclase